MNLGRNVPLTAVALLGLLAAAAPLQAATVSADLSSFSGSQPRLTVAGDAWEPFSAAQAVPSASKGGLIVRYTTVPFDNSAFPLQVSGATAVTLRPTTAGPAIPCSHSPALPILTAANANQCFYRASPGLGDAVEIYYLGLMPQGQDIRITIGGLGTATAGHTVTPFDSDLVLPGTPPSPTLGRPQATLAIVLDRSGSMAWSARPDEPGCNVFTPPSPACQPARWQLLNQAVTQMAAVAKAYAIPGDQFTVSLFSSTASVLTALTNMNTTTVNAFLTQLGMQSPGGATSIGAGVTALTPSLSNASANQVMLLFTDGDQNTAPYLVSDGTALKINATANSPIGTVTNLQPAAGTMRLCPFALRADDASGLLGTNYLQDIATLGCDGLMNSAISINPTDPSLIQFFLQVLNTALIGDKLEIVKVASGSIPASEFPSGSQTFTLSRDDGSFTVLIRWTPPENGLSSVVLSKDGVDFPLGEGVTFAQIDRGRDFLAATLRQPFCNGDGKCVEVAGDWTLTLRPFFEVGGRFDWNSIVISDNAALANTFKASQPVLGVGRSLLLQAEPKENDARLAGLAAGSVKALVARPGQSLGNVLSAAKVQPIDPTDADPISAAGRKAAAMLNDPALRETLLAALKGGAPQEVVLAENAPGVYTAQFDDTAVEGVYAVRFLVDATAGGNGRFTREFETAYYVRVVPDPAATLASATITPRTPCDLRGGCFTITLRPVDGAGNLVGPGKGAMIVVRDFPGEIQQPVTDNLDGTYTVAVGYPSDATAPPTIDIGGVVVKPPLPAPDRGTLDWLWIVLILLILVALLVLYAWRRKSS